MKQVRLLKPNEIDARVGTISDKGYTLLLYKDARVDMAILDETFGPENWQRTHEVINDNLFCNIEVWDDLKKCWVKKQDVGTESNTEKEKGEASDSFKRAGVNWGIGRELYTSPFIWIKPINDEIELNEKSGKYQIKNGYRFKVSDIGYNENREINKLIIKLSKYGKETTIFTYGDTTLKDIDLPAQQGQIQFINELLEEKSKPLSAILSKYKVASLEDLTFEQAEEIKVKLSVL